MEKQQQAFKDLGNLITENSRSHSEVNSIIAQTKTIFQKMSNVLNKNMSVAIRQRALQCYVEPTLMYGCEVWTIIKQIQKRVEAVGLWFWRRMLRIP